MEEPTVPSPRSAGLIAVVVATSFVVAVQPVRAETAQGAQVAQRAWTAQSARTAQGAQAAHSAEAAHGTLNSVGSLASAQEKDPGDLTALRKEAEKSAKELEAADKALIKRRTEIETAEKELKAKLDELTLAERELAVRRKPVSQIAEALYQQPLANGFTSLLSGEADIRTLRAMADTGEIVANRQQAVEVTSRLHAEKERLAAEAQELRAGNLLAEAQMSAEVDLIRQRSDKVVKSLTQALVKLGIKIDKVGRAALGCNPLQIGVADDYPNGLIPGHLLCPLQQKGHQLRADAAIAFVSLNEAYKRQFGRSMCVSDAYRNLSEQQSIYYRRPGFAAVPGRSNHGLGLAVDLCGGVERFRSAEFNWLEKNGKRYGWIHPDWAYSSPFEPWHWEYDPQSDSIL
ncbi:D-alanyl-D-alanine carboxypeptidase family protein [Nonomuraea sp. NPDC050663]|uniref:D-alanyl-D-alanine carboxypeptidase family protein n=1 Tax=Nonomuraea sp. NPDC050663 TaxID=3364370 RepID=UPI0037A3A92E